MGADLGWVRCAICFGFLIGAGLSFRAFEFDSSCFYALDCGGLGRAEVEVGVVKLGIQFDVEGEDCFEVCAE